MPSGMDTRHYQPSITRLSSLSCLFVITLVLIALTELAVQRLPAHNAAGVIASLGSAEVSAIVERRHAKPYPQTEVPTAAGAPPPTDFLGVEAAASTSLEFSAAPTGFLPIAAASTAVAQLTPAASNFLPIVQSLSSSTSAPPPAVFLPVEDSATATPTAPQTTFLPLTTTSTEVVVGAPPPTNFLAVANSVTSATSSNAALSTNLLPVVNPVTPTTAVNPITQSSNPITQSVTPTYRTGEAAGEEYSIGPGGLVIIAGTTFNTATPTTATLDDGNVVAVGPTGAVSVQEAQHQGPAKQSITVTPQDYVLGTWIPTFLAVLFSIPWHLLASAVKEIEPFYQLHSIDGVLAKDSIALDYRASISVVATFTAIKKRHYLVWWSGLMSLIILILAPLASETVFIGFTGTCTATSGRSACFPELSVYPTAARVVQGILAFLAVLTFALAIAIMQRKSGVYANPLSIAGLATLFQDQRLIEDFRRLNAYSTRSKEIRMALEGTRYRIGSYSEIDGTMSYGMTIVHSNNAHQVVEDRQTSSLGGKKYTSVAVNAVDEHPVPAQKKPSSSPWVHPAVILLFALFVCGLEALIIYYNRTGGDTGFERFMDSEAFGVSFLFTAIGVILKMYWSLLDDDIRSMEPYRQLLHGSAKATDSILLAPHSNPFTGVFHSLTHGHFFNTYISIVAILCEPLIVALANIPFKPGNSWQAYQAANGITIAILLMMLIGIVWMLCRKKTPGMMRRPDTIASVLLTLCGSHMLGDFRGMAMTDRRTRDEVVKEWDKRYTMGSLIGVDGVEREGVDESMFVGTPSR